MRSLQLKILPYSLQLSGIVSWLAIEYPFSARKIKYIFTAVASVLMTMLLSHLFILLLSFLNVLSLGAEFLMIIYCKEKDSKPSNLATHTEIICLMPPAVLVEEVRFDHAYTLTFECFTEWPEEIHSLSWIPSAFQLPRPATM